MLVFHLHLGSRHSELVVNIYHAGFFFSAFYTSAQWGSTLQSFMYYNAIQENWTYGSLRSSIPYRSLQTCIILFDLWLAGNVCAAFESLMLLLTRLLFCFHVYLVLFVLSSFQTWCLSKSNSSWVANFCFSLEHRTIEMYYCTHLGAQNCVSIFKLIYLLVLLPHWIAI